MCTNTEVVEGTRICEECEEIIYQGFVIDTGYDYKYFCEEECLHKNYSPEEYRKLKNDDMAYWTQF